MGFESFTQTPCEAEVVVSSDLSPMRKRSKVDKLKSPPTLPPTRPRASFARRKVPKRIHREVANRIRRRRQKLGISIKRLASLTGLHRCHLTDIERGAPNLTIATVLHLVQSLDTTVAELFRGIEDTAINDDWRTVPARARAKPGLKPDSKGKTTK